MTLNINTLSLKLIVLGGPSVRSHQEYMFAGESIVIGRSDEENRNDESILRLDSDLQVSRRHARLWADQGCWFIEDSGSKHGTIVNDRDIKALGAQILTPGDLVWTGETYWTTIPGDWFYLCADDVLIYGSYMKSICYALYHCHAHLVGPLFVKNFGKHVWEARDLTVEIGDGVYKYSEACTVRIPALQPGQQKSLNTRGITLQKAVISPHSTPTSAHMTVQTSDAEEGNVRATLDVTILAYWSWPYDRAARRTVAAFVCPNNAVVRRIVSDAQGFLVKDKDGADSFQGLLNGPQRQEARKGIMEVIYDYLKEQCHLDWIAPKSEGFYQIIKPPHHIFNSGLAQLRGEGTCIDISLLMASCLESVQLYPIILITGDHQGSPNHALVGCWIGHHGGRPIIEEKERILSKLHAGNIFVVESTGCAANVASHKKKLSFEEAIESAETHIQETSWVHAIDIGALRPKKHRSNGDDPLRYEGIAPLETALEPLVQQAQAEARKLAQVKNRNAIELLFLFYGCMVSRGEVICWLLEDQMRRNIESLCKQMQERISMGQKPEEPHPTSNYILCQTLSEEIAHKSGSVSVQEKDLIWAMLLRAPHSKNFSSICRDMSINLETMRQSMQRKYRLPEITPIFESAQL